MNPFKYMMQIDYVKQISNKIDDAISLLRQGCAINNDLSNSIIAILEEAKDDCESFDDIFG